MRSIISGIIGVLVCGFFISTAFSQSQSNATFETSYDCAKASDFVERAVCGNRELAKLDSDMAQAYRAFMGQVGQGFSEQKSLLLESQKKWLKSIRQYCKPANLSENQENATPQTLDCLANHYARRLVAIVNMDFMRLEKSGVSLKAMGATNKACLGFDEKLKPDQSLPIRSYIKMTPQRDYSVRMEEGYVCINAFPYSSHTQVTLRAGLTGVSGKQLLNDARFDVHVKGRKPSIAFTNNRYILPATGDPILPIRTINHSSVPLSLFHIDERNFKAMLERHGLGRHLSHWDFNAIARDEGALVWKGKIDINRVQDQEIVTQVPLADFIEDFLPGMYILGAKSNQRNRFTASQWILMTDIGLSLFKGQNGLSIQARSLKTAKPLGKTRIKLVAKNNMVLADHQTDDNGWLKLSPALMNGKGGKEPLYITADDGKGGFSFLALNEPALDLSDHGVSGKRPPGPVQVFLYSERGVYRPGETIKLGYILQDDKARSVSDIPLTIVLRRSDGVEVQRFVSKPDTLGGGLLDVALSSGVPTGRMTLSAYTDPQKQPIGQLNIQVEDFVPERLDVSVKSAKSSVTFGQETEIDIQADYLFGAPAEGLRVRGNAFLRTDPMPFAQLKDYRFGLQGDQADDREPLQDQILNQRGALKTAIPAFNAVDLSSPMRIESIIEVMDTDGRPSWAKISLPVIHHDAVVGLKPSFKGDAVEYHQDVPFTAISVDAKGKAISGRDLDIEWVREERDYHWYQYNGQWQYNYDAYDHPIHTESVTTSKDGTVAFSHHFDRWGYYRVTVTDSQTGAASDHTFRVGWWAGASSPDTPDALELSVEATDIAPGQDIKAFVKAPFSGSALITVAQKDVIWSTELTLPKEGAEFSIPVKPSWGAGAYVMVTAYRPGEQNDHRGPGRAVGAQWVSFGNAARELDIHFDLPDHLQPSTELIVPVEVKGHLTHKGPIHLAMFAVDEGILRLTGYQSPKPDEHFLAQQFLQLAYHDIYGRLILPEKGRRGTVRTGGDAAVLGNRDGLSKHAFKTVALSTGITVLDKNGQGEVRFNIPDFNGKLRVFGIAYSRSATGSGVDEVIVRSPIVADLLPARFLGFGDEAQFPLRFQNIAGDEGSYKITLSADGPLVIENPSWELESKLAQSNSRWFGVKANGVGQAKLNLLVEGPNGYKLNRKWDLEIRPTQAWQTTKRTARLRQGQSLDLRSSLLDGFLDQSSSVFLTLSPKPEFDVQTLITDLDRYPYGCIEQTTSRAFPLLSFEELGAVWKDIDYDRHGHAQKLKDAIASLYERQKQDGSFGLWSRLNDSEPWLTAYVMDFLTQSRAAGFDGQDHPFQRGLAWMKRSVERGDFDVSARAYMLLVLARNGQLSTSHFKYEHRRLRDENLSLLERAQLAAASHAQGVPFDKISSAEIEDRALLQESYYHNYGSKIRDLAMVLSLPSELFEEEDAPYALVTRLFGHYQNTRYTSTQEKGWLLRAAQKLVSTGQSSMDISINNQNYRQTQAERKRLNRSDLKFPQTIKNNQDAPVYVHYSVTGIPVAPLPATQNEMTISRAIYGMDGTKHKSLDQVKTGDTFLILLEGESLQSINHRALIVDLLPAGFEIERNALSDQRLKAIHVGSDELSTLTFKAERDDRYVAAVNLTPKSPAFKIAYIVRAVTPGTYIYPAPFVEDMYMPNIFARGEVSSLRVIADAP